MERIDEYSVAALVICLLAIIFLCGMSVGEMHYENLKQQCARQNNVYECVIVAVPKEGE